MAIQGRASLPSKAAGQKSAPAYHRATDALDGQETFDVVIFKGASYGKPMTPDSQEEMEKAAQLAFVDWTGDLKQSAAKLAACGGATSR